MCSVCTWAMAQGAQCPAEGSRLDPAWAMHQQGLFRLSLLLSALGKTRCLTASTLCHRHPTWEPAAGITKDSKDGVKTPEQVITDSEPAVAQGWLGAKS